VYASLGDEAVAAALQEAEVDYLLTSGDLVNKSLVGVLKKVPTLKAVIWAPFDSFSAKLKVKEKICKLFATSCNSPLNCCRIRLANLHKAR
jgi:hypothetical protein